MALVHKTYGIRFPASPMITERIRGSIELGRYEAYEAKAALALAKDGDSVLELGGGAGFMSTLLSQQFKLARYALVEADYRMVPVIREMHTLNGVSGVVVHHAMASAKEGSAPFALAGNFTASSAQKLGIGRREVEVQTISLNTLVAEYAPNVLVCDIEGGEVDVLCGSQLDCVRSLIVELHPDVTGLDGVRRVFDALHGQGLVYHAAASFGDVVSFIRKPSDSP